MNAGYLQRRDGVKLTLPPSDVTTATLSVSPNFNASSTDPVNFPVKIDPTYGSLHANFTVPAGAQLVQYQVSLDIGSSRGAATESFQVADPRPPTAVLNLTLPDWVRA